MRLTIAILLLFNFQTSGQEIKVEYNKKTDFSKYKTFCFGEGLVVAQSTLRQVSDVTFSNWIINGIVREFERKSMTEVDSLGDVNISYALIRTAQLDIEGNGPLGMTPGSSDRTWSRNYTESTLIIDLKDRNDLLIWRVKANFDISGPNSETTIDTIVGKGFKKFHKVRNRK
jgi:hypothetical protein